MSGSTALAPFLAGITVVDGGDTDVTAMATRLLHDLGARVVDDVRAADVVVATRVRDEAVDATAWVTVTPFGASGPRADWRATDLGIMAASGNLFATGDGDRPPVRCAGEASRAHGAPEVAFAAVTALASGRPRVDVDVSLQEVVLVANMGAGGRYARTKHRGRRLGANIGRTREVWPCADGWVSFGLRGGRARVPSLQTLSSAIGDPVLVDRDWEAFDHTSESDDDLEELERIIGNWFATNTMQELYELACETNLMLAPVNSPRELYGSAQLAARNFFTEDGEPHRWAHVRSLSPGRRQATSRTQRTAGGGGVGGGGAWAGTNIVEFGAGAAGPIATRYFAEHGATVLRVESSTRPDFLRSGAYAEMFDALNCGKRSVRLNLKHPEGHALARRLVNEWGDAVAENFAPRAMRSLRLTYDDLAAERPDLVMISACLNGQTGPHRDYPGFGGQGSALSGFNYLTGWPDRAPVGPFGTITDSLAPRFVAFALGAALLHRRATGEGAYIDVSQVECATWTLSDWLLAYQRDGVIGERRGNDDDRAVLHDVFRCAGDDRWVAIACWNEQDLAQLWTVVDTDGDLDAWTAERSPLQCAEALQSVGVEAVPVQDFGDLNDDPQLAYREHFVDRIHPELGHGRYERNGFRLHDGDDGGGGGDDGDRDGYDRAGPTLGQDDEWVLGDVLGLSTAEQTRLRDDGALT